MIIKLWYYVEDLGDGSTATRYFVHEAACQGKFDALEGEDATHHYNDYTINYMLIDTNDFPVCNEFVGGNKQYSTAKTYSLFDAWYEREYMPESKKEEWRTVWENLEDQGVDDIDDVLNDIISIARK